MSSFKRSKTAKQPSLPPGTRSSPSSVSTTITSTGIPSLDDILGGGLPLSCSLLVLAPDCHSAYGELVQKYFIAQGLSSGQELCIVDDNAEYLVKECMWTPSVNAAPLSASVEGDEDDTQSSVSNDKIKIAWRYEQMKKFQTKIQSTSPSAEEYCHTFDLTCRIPDSVTECRRNTRGLICMAVSRLETEELSTTRIIRRLTEILKSEQTDAPSATPLRLCIPSLGSPQWGDLNSQHILYFLYSIRALVHKYPHACVSVSLYPSLCVDSWGGPGWTQKLGWLSDAAITMSAFTANPSFSALFPAHHGLVHIHTLPAPHILLPPSDKFSTLRGLSSSGENNLAFKCTRKRLVFETLHLDLEGGVGERRTTPSTAAMAVSSHEIAHDERPGAQKPASAAVSVEVQSEAPHSTVKVGDAFGEKPKKAKKKVAFQADRPDLYDF